MTKPKPFIGSDWMQPPVVSVEPTGSRAPVPSHTQRQ